MILTCDEFAIDANDNEGIMNILTNIMQQDPSGRLYNIYPEEIKVSHPSMPKVTIDFLDNSSFERVLDEIEDIKNFEDELNQTLMYKDKLVNIKIIPRSMAFQKFQAKLNNFDPNIKSKTRITEILYNRIKLNYTNELYRWFAITLTKNKLIIPKVNLAEFHLELSPDITIDTANIIN